MRPPKIIIEGTRFRPEPVRPGGQCLKTQQADHRRRMRAIAIAAHAEDMYKMLVDICVDRDVDFFDTDALIKKVESTYEGLVNK